SLLGVLHVRWNEVAQLHIADLRPALALGGPLPRPLAPAKRRFIGMETQTWFCRNGTSWHCHRRWCAHRRGEAWTCLAAGWSVSRTGDTCSSRPTSCRGRHHTLVLCSSTAASRSGCGLGRS